jgi:hypothetical protein
MKNLKNTTIIIPLNLESEDRIRNTYIVLSYILSNLDTNVIIKEVDDSSKFIDRVIPLLRENLNESQLDNLNHIFEKKTSNIFHKSKYINDMLSIVTTEVVCNYDIDVILPLESYIESENMCRNGYDLVYPYEHGSGQYRLTIPKLNDFLKLPRHILKFEEYVGLSLSYDLWTSSFGHTQFFNTKSFIKNYMMNENFSSYSPEDLEISIRFEKLSCKIGRVNNKIIHFEHERFFNSMDNQESSTSNWIALGTVRDSTKEQLIDYYNNQEYYQKRINKK